MSDGSRPPLLYSPRIDAHRSDIHRSPTGWGGPALRRATGALAVTQLVSWGVLFYGFAVVAPDVTTDTGWPESLVAGAFSVGLLGPSARG